MEKELFRLKELVEKYATNTCTRKELDELMMLVDDKEKEAQFQAAFRMYWKKLDPAFSVDAEWDNLFQQMMNEAKKLEEIPVISLRPTSTWKKYIVAASVIFLLAVGTLWLINTSPEKKLSQKESNQDVLPGKEGAILTLADGKQIVLDAASDGKLTEGVFKKDNRLVYQQGSIVTAELHTITTPPGRQYNLTLADGSKVWLDAGSSIKFPSAFVGSERRVEITGEVYFEVSKKADMPFRVIANELTVEVLGTQFNVNAYKNESATITTLIEGSVKVRKGNQEVKLSPGQQSLLLHNTGNLSHNKEANMEEVVAWKNGYFHFDSADLPTILRQLARWYDVEVVYESKMPTDRYFVILNRNSTLSSVLKALDASEVKFRIEGRNLIVKAQ